MCLNKNQPLYVFSHCEQSVEQFQRLNTEFLRGKIIYRSAEIAQQPLLPSGLCSWQAVCVELRDGAFSAFPRGFSGTIFELYNADVKVGKRCFSRIQPFSKTIKC